MADDSTHIVAVHSTHVGSSVCAVGSPSQGRERSTGSPVHGRDHCVASRFGDNKVRYTPPNYYHYRIQRAAPNNPTITLHCLCSYVRDQRYVLTTFIVLYCIATFLKKRQSLLTSFFKWHTINTNRPIITTWVSDTSKKRSLALRYDST